ncbi:hypothetical protein BDV95DRAFT_604689 [Massariosphaeria phaeospora]|uniref:Uncharacterized protein n=1 Tax=Massariosphaeria phaeospora TaxID=100035 RepID=A0A7C8MC35_9PLEO|nr:hypothetical protein BDV95DRAFT_604689 [Massariosphaeria phaeospora]
MTSNCINSIVLVCFVRQPSIYFSSHRLSGVDRTFDMLRLRPSEITLTAADMEETQRRMARNQAARATWASVNHGPRARLRRGAQRSRDDAITQLGNIPILEPQQAVIESIEDDSEDDLPDHMTSPRVDSLASTTDTPAVSLPQQQTPLAPSGPALPPSAHNTPLTRNRSPSIGTVTARPTPRGNVEEDTSETPKHQVGVAGFGRTRTNTSEDFSGDASQSGPPLSTDGLDEAAGTRAIARISQTDSVRQQSSHAPSPLQQWHALSSPHQTQTQHHNPGQDKKDTQYYQTQNPDGDIMDRPALFRPIATHITQHEFGGRIPLSFPRGKTSSGLHRPQSPLIFRHELSLEWMMRMSMVADAALWSNVCDLGRIALQSRFRNATEIFLAE